MSAGEEEEGGGRRERGGVEERRGGLAQGSMARVSMTQVGGDSVRPRYITQVRGQWLQEKEHVHAARKDQGA
jgi:hypothetical protein